MLWLGILTAAASSSPPCRPTEPGPGFQEFIYQRTAAIELRYADLAFEREKEM